MGFVSDRTINGRPSGRRLPTTAVISVSALPTNTAYLANTLGDYWIAAICRGVRTENGPEFVSRAFMRRAPSRGILHLMVQRLPMKSYCIENFNGKLGDGCLSEH
jgi:hypothetical protein